MATQRLTKQLVERAVPGAQDTILRDSEVRGFICKITPKGRRVYMLYYRTHQGQERRPVIGVHGDITCDQARRIAQEWKADIAKGGDPSGAKGSERKSPTVREFCERYLREYAAGRKKSSSYKNDVRLLEQFIEPAFGSRKLASITTQDVTRLHNSQRSTPYQANRTLALLSKMFNLAEAWDERPQGSNPVKHVQKFQENKRERYLSAEELARLGEALAAAERDAITLPQIILAIRLLLLTGCRLNEILTLRWTDIDWDRGLLNLRDSKTGVQSRAIGAPALALLKAASWRMETEFVIPGRHGNTHLINLSKAWQKIRVQAGLPDVRIHDLRHTHASTAAGSGMSLLMIGKLLGHTQAATTQRYAHLAADPVHSAANQVATAIAGLLGILPEHNPTQ